MTDINDLTIIGRLTRAPDNLAYTTSGKARLNFSIAVNRSQKQNGAWGDKASFFDVTVWGKTAENIKPYLTKGKQVAVHGYLDQQRWEKDGQKFSKIVIIADEVQLLGSNGANEEQGVPQQQADAYSDTGSGDDFPEDCVF